MLKYLDRYADPLSRGELPPGGPFQAAVVVPAYGEEPPALGRLLDQGALASSGASSEANLLIVVVNEPEDAPAAFQQANERLISAVKSRFPAHSVSGQMTFCAAVSPSQASPGVVPPSVLLVDLTGSPLPKKEGVGRARKIGLDLALRLYADGLVRLPYAASTDCDVTLPADYLGPLTVESALAPSDRSSALLYPYRHIGAPSPELELVMVEVEITFRHYVLGLAEAGSPYAYHSLGSALAVSLPHYAQVRGVPPRAAGEDFYLLSKLAQLAPLRRLSAPRLSIQTRLSDRVPFGTGPSLARAQERASGGVDPVLTHHPEAFRLLGVALGALTERVRSESWCEERALFSSEQKVPLWVQKWAHEFWASLSPGLLACPTPRHRLRRLHERLDALCTLQFIHQAHREGLPRLPVEEVFRSLGVPQKQDVLRVLAQREERLPEWVGPCALFRS